MHLCLFFSHSTEGVIPPHSVGEASPGTSGPYNLEGCEGTGMHPEESSGAAGRVVQ